MDRIIAQNVKYASTGAHISAYLARPDADGRFPAVIVIHEIFGLDRHIEDVARRFAQNGYVALAPDLYSRPGTPVTAEEIAQAMDFMMKIPPARQRDQAVMAEEMSKLPEQDRAAVGKTMKWLMHRDYSTNVTDLAAAIDYLSSQPYVRKGAVASLGFCMGGTLSARLAAKGADLAACVIFYGEAPAQESISAIKCPVLGLYGAEDHRITDALPQFDKSMRDNGKSFSHHVYPGAHHAFFNDTRPHYNKQAAEEAWKEVLSFLAEHCK